MEKLDSFNKILLATGAINYMASMIDGVNVSMRQIPIDHYNEFHKEGVEKRDQDMVQALGLLKQAMEILGNSLPEICAIDQYVTTPAFNVVMHGHDDVDGDFDEL